MQEKIVISYQAKSIPFMNEYTVILQIPLPVFCMIICISIKSTVNVFCASEKDSLHENCYLEEVKVFNQ